jgi:hypothetical protein
MQLDALRKTWKTTYISTLSLYNTQFTHTSRLLNLKPASLLFRKGSEYLHAARILIPCNTTYIFFSVHAEPLCYLNAFTGAQFNLTCRFFVTFTNTPSLHRPHSNRHKSKCDKCYKEKESEKPQNQILNTDTPSRHNPNELESPIKATEKYV